MQEKDLTLVLIKPDGLIHSLVGDILTQLSDPEMEALMRDRGFPVPGE